MKAVQVKNYGETDAIEVNADAQKPEVKAGQVLVEVKAASLNRIDSMFRKGFLKDMMPVTFPYTLGGDFAGVVAAVGEGVTAFAVGDEVYGNAGTLKGGSGSLAEFVVATAANTAHKPKSVDFATAAAVPLTGASALQAIDTELNVSEGQKVLIQGGAGGVGSAAIQIAKLHGAYVATTVATEDVDYVKGLGADEVIDYKTQDVTDVVKDYDAVLDLAGGDNANKLYGVLKKGGRLSVLAGQANAELAKEHEITAVSQMTVVSSEQLTKLAELVDAGKVSVHVEKTFDLDQAKDAFTFFETAHPKGKVVVKVN